MDLTTDYTQKKAGLVYSKGFQLEDIQSVRYREKNKWKKSE